MRISSTVAAVFFALGLVVSAGAAHAEVRVVATVPDLAALAQSVGGDKVEVVSLALASQDPHFVDAKPSLILDLNKADLLLATGLGLESGWLPVLQTGARNRDIQTGARGYLECAGSVKLLEVPTRRIDRSEGDIHPGGNPHYLHDPRRAVVCAKAIADKLAVIDVENADYYAERFNAFKEAAKRKLATWKKRMEPHRGKAIITYHRSYVYLSSWLGLNVVARLEPKPGIAPTPRHVSSVIRTALASNVAAILQEEYYPSRTGALVAKKIGAELVVLPGATDFASGEGYLERMDRVVEKLATAMEKQK